MNSKITGASLEAEQAFENQYPAIYNHLLKYKSELSNRNKAETGIRYEWYALQRWGANYWEDFYSEKVLWKIIGSNLNFCYDNQQHFCNNAVNIMTGNKKQLLQFVGIMNSKLFNWYLKTTTTAEVQGGGIQMYSTVLEELPIKLNFKNNFEQLVLKRLNSSNEEFEKQIEQELGKHYNLIEEEIEFIESQ